MWFKNNFINIFTLHIEQRTQGRAHVNAPSIEYHISRAQH